MILPVYCTKQKHGTSLVNTTKNCNFCILLITPGLPLKWMIITTEKNALIQHCKQQK